MGCHSSVPVDANAAAHRGRATPADAAVLEAQARARANKAVIDAVAFPPVVPSDVQPLPVALHDASDPCVDGDAAGLLTLLVDAADAKSACADPLEFANRGVRGANEAFNAGGTLGPVLLAVGGDSEFCQHESSFTCLDEAASPPGTSVRDVHSWLATCELPVSHSE